MCTHTHAHACMCVHTHTHTHTYTVTPREKAKVLYNWKGSKDNHLSIKKGEVISILNKSEKWWSGESKGSVGWFPKTFVKILEEDGSHERVEKKQSSPTARYERIESLLQSFFIASLNGDYMYT